jgi:hypothetical protein
MRVRFFGIALAGVLLAAATPGWGSDGTAKSPEDVLRAYLGGLKAGDYPTAYQHISKAMRGGKDEEAWVKETKAFMSLAEVKIFDFKIQPGKIEGDVAKVPNLLESQDRFVNTLGLNEYELYTLVKEDGEWKVDSQILLEPAEVPKWFRHAQK